ncbi:hypothetical protein BDZ45DRAFT_752108 [Acephala macrosclerotiorum]|nr:hypothetical protein BDZ45DRAFT_752108 [Acephala macrosclerotiorum]
MLFSKFAVAAVLALANSAASQAAVTLTFIGGSTFDSDVLKRELVAASVPPPSIEQTITSPPSATDS